MLEGPSLDKKWQILGPGDRLTFSVKGTDWALPAVVQEGDVAVVVEEVVGPDKATIDVELGPLRQEPLPMKSAILQSPRDYHPSRNQTEDHHMGHH